MSGSKCYKCNRMGHFARECPMGSGPGPRGRGGPRVSGMGGRWTFQTLHNGKSNEKCYKCNRPGHFARDCKEEEDHCYRCDGVGHIAKDCEHSSDEPSCYNCSKMGHIARDCPEPERTCYVCNKSGHISRQCTENKSENRNAKCYVCGKIGHISRECPIGGDQDNEKRCYVCGAGGHISRDCPQGESDTTCYSGVWNREGPPRSARHKNERFKLERKAGPRFSDMNSFDCDYEMRWKRLFEKYKEKKMLLESDLQSEMEQLERRLAAVRHEYKTEKLKMELMEREAEAMLKGRPMFGCQGGNFGGMGMQDDLCEDRFDAVRNGRYEEEHIQRMPYQQGTKRGAGDGPWYLEKKRQRF